MTDRRFFGTNSLVDEQLKSLKKIEVLDGGWTKKYVDTEYNQWLEYNVDPERGYYYNLMRITPMLTTEDLIDIALTSEHPDEVSAASTRLYLEEQQEGKEFRKELLQAIRSTSPTLMSDSGDKERINTVIRSSQLLDSTNRREVLNKRYTEIESDYQYFKSSSDEAIAILLQLGLHVNNNGPGSINRVAEIQLQPGNLQLLWKYFKIFLMILGAATLIHTLYLLCTDIEAIRGFS